ncbi:zinc ABC transporter substrate-binding protein [Nocardioides sp. BP30]|uniref:metal ABC transporter solute-binding protein, Zn/Mn family n=1 Tax=Nocardioides sp. BP30 TaxID=3036374 RepID=UPI0024699366|nr:zinc ABC transporter substrate-binding protein [Nocardioides sp. BP30]WGL51112.1 zinc ABC transporter substrate-binding protein [Nocardioides sp. BP30]
MKSPRLVALVSAVLLLAPALAACGSSPRSSTDVVEVVAGENFWGDVVHQIGGSHVQVTSIITDPDEDPHEYESSDRNAIAVATARLVVRNGLGYDDFLTKLVSASGAHPKVLTVADVVGISGTDANPHLWYDAPDLPRVADAIASELAELDPANRSEFEANARTFIRSLDPLLAVIGQIKSQYAGTPVAYTERVPGYLLQAAGLRLGIPAGFAQAVEDGSDPSPQDTVAFNDAVKDGTVKVLLYNAQVTDAQTTEIKRLATDSGVPIVGVTETMPPTYPHLQDWQLAQARDLLAALQKASR